MKKIFYGIAALGLVLSFQIVLLAIPKVDGLLNQQINAVPLALTPVVITFNSRPTNADFLMLRTLGITGGYKTSELPMVLTRVNQTQFNALKQKNTIRSLYANRTFRTLNNESRKFIGIESLLRDFEVTTFNQGLPVTGKIDFSSKLSICAIIFLICIIFSSRSFFTCSILIISLFIISSFSFKSA